MSIDETFPSETARFGSTPMFVTGDRLRKSERATREASQGTAKDKDADKQLVQSQDTNLTHTEASLQLALFRANFTRIL